MILKVVDALKSFSRTDPDCEARRDLRVLFPAACCENRNILFLLDNSMALLRGCSFLLFVSDIKYIISNSGLTITEFEKFTSDKWQP